MTEHKLGLEFAEFISITQRSKPSPVLDCELSASAIRMTVLLIIML